MMGVISAATVIQEARTRLLLANRVLNPEELMGGVAVLRGLGTRGTIPEGARRSDRR